MITSRFWIVSALTVLVMAMTLGGAAATLAQEEAVFDLGLELVADGFDRPVVMLDADDGSGRMFVVEQSGRVRIISDGATLETPYLDISDQITTGNEQGLLGMALHPTFPDTGEFFIYYTDLDGHSHVERWQQSDADPNVADAASVEQILFVEQPYPNHNGGHLLFGPDGYLYIGLGDGGSGGDPDGNAQNTQTLLGSILRIDVDNRDGDLPYAIPEDNPFASGEGGRPEIWAWGLRNPWRFSFDRETGDFYAGDVGQGEYEEVDYLPAGQQGANFGWPITEGFACYEAAECDTSDTTPPIFAYGHNESGCSVVGGYVYRGEEAADLIGTYLLADYCIGTIWGLEQDANGEWIASGPVDTEMNISSFAEDADGEVYVLDLNGGIYQVVPAL